MLIKNLGTAIKFNAATQPATFALLFLRNVFVVRYLGIENYGLYIVLLTLFLFLEPLFTLIVERPLLRYLPELRAKKEYGICLSLIKMAIKWNLLAFVLISPVVFFVCLTFFNEYVTLIILLLIRMFFNIFRQIFISTLISFYEHKYKNITAFSESILSTLLVMFVLKNNPSVEMAFQLLIFAAAYSSIIFGFRVFQIMKYEYEEVDNDLRDRFLHMTSRGIISRYTTYIVRQKSEVFFLAAYHSSFIVAIYGLGYDLAFRILKIIHAPIGDLRLIAGSETFHQDKQKFILLLDKINMYTCLIFIPMMFALLILVEDIIQFFYGDDFIASSLTFRLMLVLFGFSVMTAHISPTIAVLEKFDLMITVSVFSAILNLGFNFFLIPEHGINGALISVYIATLFPTFFWSVYIKNNIGYFFPFYIYTKIIVSSLPMAILLYLHFLQEVVYPSFLQNIFVNYNFLLDILVILISSLTYPLMVKFTKILSEHDVSRIQKLEIPFISKFVSFLC